MAVTSKKVSDKSIGFHNISICNMSRLMEEQSIKSNWMELVIFIEPNTSTNLVMQRAKTINSISLVGAEKVGKVLLKIRFNSQGTMVCPFQKGAYSFVNLPSTR